MSTAILDLRHSDTGDIRYKHFIFKSGENHFQIEYIPQNVTDIRINFPFNQDSQILKLLMAVDALKRHNVRTRKEPFRLHLNIPYFPGARQDRVCNHGESLSVKVYANIINNQNFDSVSVFDPHSEVTPSLIKNCIVYDNYKLVDKALFEILTRDLKVNPFLLSIPENVSFVSPDAGSNKKIFGLSKHFGGVNVIRADKKRDVKDGKIIGTDVFADDLTGRICLIVDDICAGGRTFVELSKKLKEKNAQYIYLIVSHDEGVADRHKLREAGITKMFCGNGIREITNDAFLTQFDVFQFMK